MQNVARTAHLPFLPCIFHFLSSTIPLVQHLPIALAWSQAANNMQILPRCNFAPASFSAILRKLEVGPKLRLACRCMLVCWSQAGIGRSLTASSPGYFWPTAPIGPQSWQKAVQKPKIAQAEPMPGWGNRARPPLIGNQPSCFVG